MSQPTDFQNIILSLQHFWADRGCLIWQPYYSQVGAGTYNPATFLRVLGPEPWNVAYVEPTIRPDDGRYGENPNRMQMHYQFQVILKPDPGNPQEIYLQSLEALGIDPRQHDFRFVEDNWVSPALGAWGLGWEVWLDGQEITQFTYFQQAGGKLCDPVSVEITYGLDRIAIALQRVSGFTEIQWDDDLTCGDVNLQAEQEHSKYYFEIADIERLHQMYNLFEQEADACLAQNLVLPAHDYVLKCSHTFNVLDARGAIGVTERQAFFGRMRELSRRVSDAYLEQRQHLEFPWLDETHAAATAETAVSSPGTRSAIYPTTPSPFLLEIGSEELPAGDLDSALEQLSTSIPALLEDLHLTHGVIRVEGTPRRQMVLVEDLSPHQPDRELVIKGPPASRAFDALGEPTKAGEGFARSKGLSPRDLQVREMDGGRYVVAILQEKGRPTPEVLAEALPALLAGLRFDKPMRWNNTNVAYSRPLRWLLALYGDQVIPFSYAGLHSDRFTRGLRFLQPETIQVNTPAEYFQALADQGILLAYADRKRIIQEQLGALAAEVDGTVEEDPDLLSEVANLVEVPLAVRCAFDPAHLKLPREVLISVMKKHQRYFPVQRDDQLLPYFITVTNRGEKAPSSGPELIIEGNEHVIRARFADADFFIRDDLKKPLEAFLPRLGTLTFQQKLGSMLDKSRRITNLVKPLAILLGMPDDLFGVAQRAAELCKADLATKMVVEMTSLQGIMGRYYALHSGESQAVATAIYEHYLPRFTGDKTPQNLPGLVIGLADRLDTIAGLFAADLAPTGAKDPFAQRRAALGLVQALIACDADFDVRLALQAAFEQLPIPAEAQTQAACLAFIIERMRNLLLEQNYRYDIVDAVITEQGFNPASAFHAVQELTHWVNRSDWNTILPAYARCVRITRDFNERFAVDPAALVDEYESALFDALQRAEAEPRQPSSIDGFLNAFLPMIPVINRFFDQVLVMAEEPQLRANRLGMLQRIAALAAGAADLSRLEGF